MGNTYDDNSISRLEGAERVRFRPEALLGSKGVEGARHTVYEIIGNASDEKLSGFGDSLEIGYYEDGSISVRDYGRGVPLGYNEKLDDWNYFLIYEELYAGGKYGDSQEILRSIEKEGSWNSFNIEDYPYIITIGLNGLGAAATQCTSEYCTVSSYRDHVKSTMEYKKGSHVLDELRVEPTDEKDGTLVHWKPDSEVFTDVNLDIKWLKKLCKSLSYTSGFNIILNDRGKVIEYPVMSIKEHMVNEVGFACSKKTFYHTVLYAPNTLNIDSAKIAICYTDVVIGPGGKGNEFFQNVIEMRGGVHSEAISGAEYYFFEGVAKEQGFRVRGSDYSGCLSAVVSTLSNIITPRGQTKDSIDDMYVYNAIYENASALLAEEWNKKTPWLVEVVEKVRKNAEARVAVQELSKNIKEVEKATKRSQISEKFISCDDYTKKNYENVELWIPEGDSAGTAAKDARDSRFQCIMKIKGKSLNVFKAPINKIISNKEIRDIIAVLGCGVDLGIDDIETFDINNLRVGKIIFATDADVDGLHIRMLLFLIFYKLMPELLYSGKVYVAETPKFVISLKDGTSVFCMDDVEMSEKRGEIGEYNIKSITRFKGLGELNSDQLWDTTMNPENRVLTQIKIDRDDMDIYDVLEVFFGKSTDRRKKAILGSMMGDDFETLLENIEETISYIDGLNINSLEYEEVVL